jgi:hypothetical protein
MVYELILVALGVIIGLPLALFGVMRLDEERGRLGAIVLILGLLITFGPTVVASITHYRATGGGERYGSR